MRHSRSEPSLPSQGSPDPAVGDKHRPYEKGRGGSCPDAVEDARCNRHTLPERRPCGRGQAPTLPNKVAEGLVPSRRAGGSIGSPRGSREVPGPGKKVKPLLLHPGIPRPDDHLLSLDGRG